MSIIAARTSQISARESCAPGSQFRAQKGWPVFRFVSPRAVTAKRPDAPAPSFRAILPPTVAKMVQGRRHARPVILAILLCCTAVSAAQAETEPSAETLAPGNALR